MGDPPLGGFARPTPFINPLYTVIPKTKTTFRNGILQPGQRVLPFGLRVRGVLAREPPVFLVAVGKFFLLPYCPMTRERFSKVTEAALAKLQGEHLLAHIYIALTLHGAPGKECWPSVKAIADLIGGNRYRTALGIKKLEELGLVSPVKKVGQKTVWMICKIEKSSDTSSATPEKKLVTPQVTLVTPQVPLSDTSGATNIQGTDKEQTNLSPKLKAKNKKLRRWMSQEDSDRWDAWLTYAVLELYGGMRSPRQDGLTFRALEKVEKTGNDTQREMIRKKDFLLRVAKKADWPKPKGGTGRAGYGRRFEIVLPELLEGIEGKQDALIRYRENLQQQKKEMKF